MQTVVYNARKEKSAFNSNNWVIGREKLAVQEKKLAFGDKKLDVGILRLAIKRRDCNKVTKKIIISIYDAIEIDQIFGTSEVKICLNVQCCLKGAYEEIAGYRSGKKRKRKIKVYK